MIARDYCKAALQELGVYGPSDDPDSEVLDFTLQKLNRLFDRWNARSMALWVDTVADFITTGISPHTIGPTGTFVQTPRPVQILNAGVVANPGVSTELVYPIAVQDRQWYAEQRAPRLTTAFPSDLYYAKDVPDGLLYFFGIPSAPLTVRLWTRKALAQVAIGDTIVLSDGYWDAVVMSLAESMLTAFPRKTIADEIKQQARDARATAFANTDDPCRLTSDYPGSGGGAADIREF